MILGTGGDEPIHGILDIMYSGSPNTTLQRAMHIHPTPSELIRTMLGDLRKLTSIQRLWNMCGRGTAKQSQKLMVFSITKGNENDQNNFYLWTARDCGCSECASCVASCAP